MGARTKHGYPGIYNSSALILADGDGVALAVDSSGITYTNEAYLSAGENLTDNVLFVAIKPIAGASYSPLGFTNAGAATTGNAKNAAGAIISITASNANAALRYLQIHNKASAAGAGETAIFSFPIPAGTAAAPGVAMVDSTFFGATGYYLSTGVTWAISTAAATYTAATASDHQTNGTYI